jgi:SSS family solute:Na+ symporter
MITKVIFLLIFFASMIAVGIYSSKHATNVNDFVLGGRSVGPWLTAFAYGTSYFSAVVFVGYAGQFGYKFGIASTWIGIGNAIIGSLLAWVILGRRTRVMSKHLSASTMPDYFGKRYDSNAIRIAAAAISFVFLIPYTASVYNGLSRLFGMAFNIPYAVCVIAMAVLTGLYVVLGGYMATAINDFIQGIVMLFGIVAVIVAVLNGYGGFSEAVRKLAEIESDVPGVYASFFGPDLPGLIGVVILTSLGTWGLPQMVHKFYAIKDEKSIKAGTIISTLFAIVVSGGCYFLGGFGRLVDESIFMVDGKPVYDAIIPGMLSGLPDILIGIVIVLVLSASMSTLSSLVLTSSSTLTLDLIKDNIVKKMDDKKQLLCMRIMLVFFVVISVVIALDPPTFIAQLMGISWGALAGAFLAPFMYGLYWKGVTKAAVWASFICGVGITVANMFFQFIQSPINAGAIAMVTSMIIVPIVSCVTPKIKKEQVNEIFACLEETVTVRRKRSIEE